jgi:hypothetical protein
VLCLFAALKQLGAHVIGVSLAMKQCFVCLHIVAGLVGSKQFTRHKATFRRRSLVARPGWRRLMVTVPLHWLPHRSLVHLPIVV